MNVSSPIHIWRVGDGLQNWIKSEGGCNLVNLYDVTLLNTGLIKLWKRKTTVGLNEF